MVTDIARKPTSCVAAMKHFFGFKPNQTLPQFAQEVRDAGGREFWIDGLRANGYEITEVGGS